MARQTAMLITFILAVITFVAFQATQGASATGLFVNMLYAILPSVFLAIMVGAVIPGKDEAH